MRENKITPVVTNRLYSFLNQWSWREMLEDVIDPEENDQRKTDAIGIAVSVTVWGWGVQVLKLTWRKGCELWKSLKTV